MLRNIKDESLTQIITDGNKMWENGKINKELKQIKMITIPKPKKNLDDPNKYRPIDL